MTWTLILILLASGPDDAGKAISTLPGFASEQSCQAAVEKITKHVPAVRAFCIMGPA